MAIGDMMGKIKDTARRMMDRFFYDGEAPAGDYAPESFGQPQAYASAPSPWDGAPQAQPQQPYYQQPPQAVQPQFASQYQPPERNRRSQQHTQEEKLVQFPGGTQQSPYQAGYQQPQAPQAAYQQGYQQPASYQQPQAQSPYPPQPAYAQAPQEAQPQPQQGSLMTARVVSARGIMDCLAAISLLRRGDIVLVSMEGITDPNEMRRYVDTLSGACFSLLATITKVSRFGTYLLAPQALAVFTDPASSQMNMGPRAQKPRPQQQNAPYGYQQQGYNAPYAQQPDGFTQRAAAQDAAPQPFYARQAQADPQAPDFNPQPAGYGYAPDQADEAAL